MHLYGYTHEIMLMDNWFECKVRIERNTEEGKRKRVSETYLVNAINCTEAEARVVRELAPQAPEPPVVTTLKRAKYAEMFTAGIEADRWFKVKCLFVSIDERGQEKRTPNLMLVQATDLEDAIVRFNQGMKGSVATYELHTVQDSGITDVFPYVAEVARKTVE